MRKITALLSVASLFACNSDPIPEGSIRIIELSTLSNGKEKNANGKYENRYAASVVNTTHAPVKGHVRFEIKEYGYINSSSETVTNEKGVQKTFFATLETDKIIDASYLIKAEFVRE